MQLYKRRTRNCIIYTQVQYGNQEKKNFAFLNSCIYEVLLPTLHNTVLDILGNRKVKKINCLILRSL